MFLELQKKVIFTTKPVNFPGIIFDPSLLCSKTLFLEFQKSVIFIAKPLSLLGTTLPGRKLLPFYAFPLAPLRFLQSVLFSTWRSWNGGVARHLYAYNYINLKRWHSDSADSLRVVHIFSLPRSRPLRGNSTFQKVPGSIAPLF